MQAADARVQKITEAIGALRITKQLGLEIQVKEEIIKLRRTELYLNRLVDSLVSLKLEQTIDR